MKNLILKEIKRELNWKERIILKMCKKYTLKIFKLGIQNGVNAVL